MELEVIEKEETPAIDVNQIVEAYIAIRDKIGAIDAAAETEKADLNKQMQTLEDELRKVLQGTGTSALSCKTGTVFVSEQTSAKVADWKVLIDFVKENDAYHLLNHAVSKTAVKEFLESNQVLPPGVNFTRRLNIQVRRKS